MFIALLIAGACVDPGAFGATPNDGKSDTVAIQRAIDLAADREEPVCLGKGVYHLEKAARRKQWGSLIVTRPVEIRGVGPESILRMSGSGAKDDWRAISISNVEGVKLHDFTIDGLDAFDTEEQTHLLEVAPGSSRIDIRHMVFGPMRKPSVPVGGGIGGDCIRLLGKAGDEATDISITNSEFINCDRSAISLQRGLARVLIARVTVSGTGDQAVDFEPTGKGDIRDIVMLELDVKHHPNAQGSDVIAIGGNRDDRARGIMLVDSTIDGGGIRMIDVEDVEFCRNTVNFTMAKKMPVVSILRRADRIVISNNVLRRAKTAAPGAILAATHLDKRIPSGIVFQGNKVRQETAAPIVSMNSVGKVLVRKNVIDYAGGDPKVPVVTLFATLGDVEDVRVTDNEIIGETGAVLNLGARDHRISRVDVRGNLARARLHLQCTGEKGYANISGDDASVRRARCSGVPVARSKAP